MRRRPRGALDVAQGQEPGQREVRGVLRHPQERLLPRDRLEGRDVRGVPREAERLHRVARGGKPKRALGWRTLREHRAELGYAAQRWSRGTSGVPFRTRKPLLDSDAREELESMLKEIKEVPLSLSAILSDTWTQWRESCDQPVDLRLLLPTYTQSVSTIFLAILGDTS